LLAGSYWEDWVGNWVPVVFRDKVASSTPETAVNRGGATCGKPPGFIFSAIAATANPVRNWGSLTRTT
ncbi:unnamed protein product, partial [Ectocarpus sp. 12 AP-2014]